MRLRPHAQPNARVIALVALALLLAPALAQAHDAPTPHVDNGDASTSTPSPVTGREGYTGPGREPYLNYFQGAWIYGQFTATPLGQQYPVGIRGDGDWLVWEDANKQDIFAYNLRAGSGFYVVNEKHPQRLADISGNTVVWEDYRDSRGAQIWAYFLDTGETRQISHARGNNRNPSISGDLIAWENDANKTLDIYAYDLSNKTEFPLVTGPDRDSDPLALHGKVYYRTFRFNVWDIAMVDPQTREQSTITSDSVIQSAPFTNGHDVLFLSQLLGSAWVLDRYDPATGTLVRTDLKFQDTSPTPTSGENLLQRGRDFGDNQLVARNLTTGMSVHVTGSIRMTTDAWLENRTAYVTVPSKNGTSVLAIEISPFAFLDQPALVITGPHSGARWAQPLAVTGLFHLPGAYIQPATFTYRVDDDPPVALAPSDKFRFTLDPTGVEPGRHLVVVRATFREGPPAEANILLLIPPKTATPTSLDVAEYGMLYHEERVMGAMREYVLDNPASYPLVILVLLIVIVVVTRLWLLIRPRRKRTTVEYVPPE